MIFTGQGFQNEYVWTTAIGETTGYNVLSLQPLEDESDFWVLSAHLVLITLCGRAQSLVNFKILDPNIYVLVFWPWFTLYRHGCRNLTKLLHIGCVVRILALANHQALHWILLEL